MHEDGHSYQLLVDVAAKALEVGIVVVEAGVNTPNGAEHTAFILFRLVTMAGPIRVAVQIIVQAAAVAVVESRPAKGLGVLDVSGAAKPDVFPGIKDSECSDDCLLLLWREARLVSDHRPYGGQGRF